MCPRSRFRPPNMHSFSSSISFGFRRLRSRRGGGIADQVLQGVTGSCDIKVICQGKEVTDQTSELPSPRSASDRFETSPEEDQRSDNTSSCACFKPKFMWFFILHTLLCQGLWRTQLREGLTEDAWFSTSSSSRSYFILLFLSFSLSFFFFWATISQETLGFIPPFSLNETYGM